MNTTEAQRNVSEIRTVIEGWAMSVQSCNLDGVLAHHGDDVVMFDVPPPESGVRGVDAYAATWPAFFDWVHGGARFEIDELHVDAGDDVAFAWALLRCGTENDLATNPDRRLRMSSRASGALAMLFFAMAGAVFLLAQYLQLILDYTPLAAGLALVPAAIGMIVGSGASAHPTAKHGGKIAVAAGTLLAAAASPTRPGRSKGRPTGPPGSDSCSSASAPASVLQ